ncbi:MAG: hypothetical protein DWQ58_07845 [Microcystis aeruginosa TA09]|nr:MAG: hypothetical protein DWQ58_07845 [Microcystis aeruginosa TA09]
MLFIGELSREAQLFVGWVSGSINYAGVGFHASTQPTFILANKNYRTLLFIGELIPFLAVQKSSRIRF